MSDLTEDTIRELYCAAMLASEAMAVIMGNASCGCSDEISNPLLMLIFALEDFEREAPEIVQRTGYAIIEMSKVQA